MSLFDPGAAVRLETERLILRAWRADDFEPFAAMMADEDVARFLTIDQRPMDRVIAWRSMASLIGHWAILGFGLFAVEEKASGTFIGRVGPWRPEGWAGLELGWGLARQYWGQGYALEAARAAGDWMFATMAPERIISLIHIGNQRSQHLARRLGMRESASSMHAGMPHMIWEIRRDDWR